MSPDAFRFLTGLIKDRSGLVLTSEKTYLISSRLDPVAQRHNLADVDALTREIQLRRNEELIRDAVEAMTTNESFFFRDKVPFDSFQSVVLPKLMMARSMTTKAIRIWSAAASTGQEAYSLAMIVKEMGPALAGWRIEILGTDLSTECLTRARAGLYSRFEAQRGLPPHLLAKYFKPLGACYEIDPAIRAMVRFQALNLMESFDGIGTVDIVFCRNVLIYFDLATKQKVLAKIMRLMPPDGVMVLGAAETVVGVTDHFKAIEGQRGLYSPVAEGQRNVMPQAVPAASASSNTRSSVSRST